MHMHNAIDNTKQTNHDLSDAQIESLRASFDEIDFKCFDITGSGSVSHGIYISTCFAEAIKAELKQDGIKAYPAYRYFRSMVCSFNETKVREEYVSMYEAFKFSLSLIKPN